MSTVYTINGKVLKNSANDKWLIKKEAPAPSFDQVTIGTQIWMSKNLAIDDGGEGIDIKDNVTANGVNFGTQYYYTWDAAVRVANSITGWHLPSKDEWETLLTYVGGYNIAGTKLKSTSGWNNNGNGTDDYGFTALPCGGVWVNSLNSVGEQCYLWTNTLNSDNNRAYYSLMSTGGEVYINWYDNTDCYPIRLIKDT